MTTRRSFIKTIPLTGCALALESGAQPLAAGATPAAAQLQFDPEPAGPLLPLARLRARSPLRGRIEVRDGNHQVYFAEPFSGEAEFAVGGALGTHSVCLLASDGAPLAMRTFRVDCRTAIEDEGGRMGGLLKDLYWTMATDGPVSAMRYKGEVFTCWDTWLMDNTQTLKGMKYFWPEVKSNVDFYAASQREDGMVWENFEARTPAETFWEQEFRYGDFARPAEDGRLLLRRAPVEAHVEAFLLEAIYYSWKASGDTPWMASKLDAALRSVKYATSDPYRWSQTYKLVKRGFTIDTWDFLVESEAKNSGSIMAVDLKKTHFGIFFGDNANLIVGLRRLAEMLEAAGRAEEAPKYTALAADLEARLNALAWNGEFFTHWIPEDPNVKFDLGVDMSRQVSLSNAYSLNRGIRNDQCAAIVRTYQRIRKEMPESSPGEFYAIYPPYERGFSDQNAKWEYMNGGVMSCTAGELAWGAFNHGFEAYGADILERYRQIAARHHGLVPAILRGKQPTAPERRFTQVDLRSVANADFGAGAAGVVGWTGEPENDLANMPTGRQVFREIPFDVIAPASNGQRACLAISSAPRYKRQATLAVNAAARSFYLLHTKSGDSLAGKLTLRYADGTTHWEYIRAGVNINHWWAPADNQFNERYGPGPERLQVAWRGPNKKFENLGVFVAGFEHPHPEKTIASLDFECMDTDAKWMVLAVTLSDAPMYLPPWNDVSFGMPNNWGAAALVAALVEGLAGVRDQGAAFSRARIAPRWTANGTRSATVTVRYPASQGYVRYEYLCDEAARRIAVDFAGSAEEFEIAVQMPNGARPGRATLDGREVQAETQTVESSRYAVLQVKGARAHRLTVALA
ncbi:MAG: hypothetical protein WCE75_15680 [Terracidiphilus sp.]